MFSWLRHIAQYATRALRLEGYATPPREWLSSGIRSDAGIDVTEATALNLSAIWAGINRITSAIATLPIHLYKIEGDSSRRDSSHPITSALRHGLCPDMTPAKFVELMAYNVLMHGNAYAQIQTRGNGEFFACWPIHPQLVTVEYDGQNNLIYKVNESGVEKLYSKEQIVHIVGSCSNGLVGKGILQVALQSLGAALATDKFAAKFFANSSVFSSVISYPGRLGDDGEANLRKSIELMHRGSEKAHKLLILEEDAKVAPMSFSPEESQLLGLREFTTTELARWLGLPPHMVGDMSHATFSNIEQQEYEFVVHCLRPKCVDIEQELNRKLLSRSERDKYYFKFNIDALLRGDTKSRYEAHFIAVGRPIKTVNEARSIEGLPPIPGGDELFAPLNTAPAKDISEIQLDNKHGVAQ